MISAPIFTAAQMKACDGYTIDTLGIPSQVLMERAARCAVAFLRSRSDLFPAGEILLLCGSGNNGGDGFAMARFLTDGSEGEPRRATVLYTGRFTEAGLPDETCMSPECRRQYRLAREVGVSVLPSSARCEVLGKAAAVVDAVFGIGLDRPITGETASLLSAVADTGLPVLAVDIPSGIRADTGEVMGVALPAQATVTMQALKAGLLLYPGAELCGEIAVADVGIDLTPADRPFAYLTDEALLQRVLPPRARRSHKGTYGWVALLCGSEGMSGAAMLATKAALRSGAGLARVLTPNCNRAVLQSAIPEAIVSVYGTPAEAAGYAEADALVLGCGLGVSELSREALRRVLNVRPREGSVPVVLDADGLNHTVKDPTLWDTALLSAPDRQVVITPHPAEMSRLCGRAVPDILAHLPAAAAELARARGVTVVLKDAHTVVASPDGTLFICAAGNAGMAKGGSGDALAGIIGALLAQNCRRLGRDLTVAEVAAAGVYLHARAGDLAAAELGEYGMLPSDLIEKLPAVTKALSDSATRITPYGHPSGEPTMIRQEFPRPDLRPYLGKTVTIEIDRPIGYIHRKGEKTLIYPINYGYVPHVLGGDGEELDVFLLGVDHPVETFTGVIIGIVYRADDVEDKLIMAPVGQSFTVEEMTEAVRFQEKYYDSSVVGLS